MVRIDSVKEVTPELQQALARLLPQLNPTHEVPDLARLERLLADPAVTLLIAVDGDDIVGTTTVIVYTTPFWIKARLDEVVVDATARGKGVGEALVKAALESPVKTEPRSPSSNQAAAKTAKPPTAFTSDWASGSATRTSCGSSSKQQ